MNAMTTGSVQPRPQAAPRYNADQLVALVVAGQVGNALVRGSPYRIGRDGVPRVVPGTGGIALNRRVGDRAVGLAGDHVEPGASVRNLDRESPGRGDATNRGLLLYSCVGNLAQVVGGPASGRVGTVTGKHGGINNVLVDFPPTVLRRLRIGDRIQITALGQGMRFPDHPGVRALNLSPRLLRRWGLRGHGRHLHVPVTHIIPAGLMGSGLGRSEGVLGDTDVQLSDRRVVGRFGLGSLRMGDLVALCPLDYRHGASRIQGAVTVGVVVHSDSRVSGHGPGVTPLLISATGDLLPVFDPDANIGLILGLRRRIAPGRSLGRRELDEIWRPTTRRILGQSSGPRAILPPARSPRRLAAPLPPV